MQTLEETRTETGDHSLISSDRVNGTEVFSPQGERVGQIDHLVIDKQSGNIAYAVMSFGGFLGIGAESYPLPWAKLSYDTSKGGFVTDVTREQLEGAPERTEDWYSDRQWEERQFAYFGAPYYWL